MRVLTATEIATMLDVTPDHVRRIKGLQAVRGYPEEQVRDLLRRRGKTDQEIEVLLKPGGDGPPPHRVWPEA